MTFEKRAYQQQAIIDIRNEFKKGNKKVLLTQPTGAGKAVIALQIIIEALCKNKRVAFFLDRITLLDQFAKLIYDSGIDQFGIMQADNVEYNPELPLQIITAQTLSRRMIDKFDLYIVDECHVIYKSILTEMKKYPDSYWIGLTATPFTKGLGKVWDSLVNSVTTAGLIKEGFLSKYIAYGPSKPDLKGVKTVGDDYNKKQLAERTDQKQLIGDIVEHWFKLASDKRTVVMAVNVAHAEHICESFKEKGIKADVIHCYLKNGEAPERLQRFRDGELQMLCSVDMISRGFDMPAADCIIIARPTKSLNYHIQAIGRVLRASPGKEYALILDHAGNIERLGFPDEEFEMKLDMGIKKPKEKGKPKEKLPKPCPKCFTLFKGQECPKCGFKKKRQPGVETKDGELKQLTPVERGKKTTIENKEKLYAKLLAGAKAANFNNGWAAHKYREYFGVWPAKKIEHDQQFHDFLINLPRQRMMKIIWGLVK